MRYHFEGDLTARDCKRHIPHPFTMPALCSALEIRLRFAPYHVRGIHNRITLTLFDPTGFRGAGHLYLSAGPQLDLQARSDGGARAMVGDTVAGPATCTLAWSNCPADALIRVLANGRLNDRWPAAESGARAWRLEAGFADWVGVEVRAADGERLAVTNPIFVVA